MPSILFLAHYLPDAPDGSQELNIASLVLGHNGIWGDLPALSETDQQRFGHWLSLYKQVRDDVTAAAPIQSGCPGGTPEVHEKINPATGRGLVSLFSATGGDYVYLTKNHVASGRAAMDGVEVEELPDGCARLKVKLKAAGGVMALFGVENR